MSFGRFLSILAARWKLVASVFAGVLVLALAASLLMPRTYTATASVVADTRNADPIAGAQANSNALTAPSYMATQVDILLSDRVAQRVAQTLKLNEHPLFRAKYEQAGRSEGSFEAWMLEILKKNLRVVPSRDSNVITVAYQSPDARLSADMANAFVKAYIDSTLELRVEPAKQYSAFFEDRARQLRAELEGAQSKLADYQRAKGLTAVDASGDIENARLAELSSEVVRLQSESVEAASRQAQARTRGDDIQDTLASGLIAGLKADLAREEAKLEQLGSHLGDSHPQMIQLRSTIAAMRTRISRETQRVTASVGSTNVVVQSKLNQARAALEAQRSRVLLINGQRSDMAVLQRDVEAAKQAYDAVLGRMNQASLESQASMTNVSVLSAAVIPSRPSSPRPVLNLVMAALAGLILAAGLALMLELMDRRVRTAEDLVEAIDLPVLGTMPKAASAGLLGQRETSTLQRKVMGHLPAPRTEAA